MTTTSHTVGQTKHQSEDETPNQDATAPKEAKVEQGETVEHAAKVKAQGSDARSEHNAEHVPGGAFYSKCYFCTAQEAGATKPVLVPDQPPAAP